MGGFRGIWLDLNGCRWIWAIFILTIWLDLDGSGQTSSRFGWILTDLLYEDLSGFGCIWIDLRRFGQDLGDFIGFVWIWAGFERIPLDLS